MQLLIAHGGTEARLALKRVAADVEGLETVESGDGVETLDMLLAPDSPVVAVVDWALPGLDGIELCRLVHTYHEAGPPYIILLAHDGCDVAAALDAGASDCVRTPVNGAELRARIDVGRRFAALPWERLTGTATLDAQSIRDPKTALAAQCSLDGDEPEDEHDAGEEKCELESVLVAQW